MERRARAHDRGAGVKRSFKMSRTRILAGMLVISAAGLLAAAPARSEFTVFEPTPAQSEGAGSRLSGFSDEGTFIYYSNQQEQIGTASFKWSSSGAYENKFVQTVFDGQKVTSEMRVSPDSEGRWSEISIKSPLGAVLLE